MARRRAFFSAKRICLSSASDGSDGLAGSGGWTGLAAAVGGGVFGVVDLKFAPFFERYKLNHYFWAFQFPELPRIERWRHALEEHPLIRATAASVC